MSHPLSILAVTNMYPTPLHPTLGVFVEQQVKGLREVGLQVEVFYVDRTTKGTGAYFQMLKPLSAAVRESRPALLHVMYGGVMAQRVSAWNSRCPTIITFHGSDLLGENFSGRWRRWISHYGVRCSRRAARKAQGVIVVSHRLKQALPVGLDESKVRVIPCGIDLERFHPMDQLVCQRRLGWLEGTFHVLFASSNGDPVKRPELASATVAALKTAGVRAQLHYMRGVSNAEVPLWMNASHALLLTSAHEGSPTVVKEALACGLPVVSVDVGDVAERIEGVVGCHLALAKPEDLAANLRVVQQTGCRVVAREKIQTLSLRNVALKLEHFYRDTLARWNQTVEFEDPHPDQRMMVSIGEPPVAKKNVRFG
ncbi:MAG: glycosyltransferase [Verrucomicrobia subdivision 3 bacterium]|nr:glycosyltransferase [Limisphaerales bacterium]